jgi:hypothetical protein
MADNKFKATEINSTSVNSNSIKVENIKIDQPTQAGWVLTTNNAGEVIPSPLPTEEDKIIKNETPMGEINGVNVFFSVRYTYQAGTLEVFLNGIKLKNQEDYEELGSNLFMMKYAPIQGDLFVVNYIKI